MTHGFILTLLVSVLQARDQPPERTADDDFGPLTDDFRVHLCDVFEDPFRQLFDRVVCECAEPAFVGDGGTQEEGGFEIGRGGTLDGVTGGIKIDFVEVVRSIVKPTIRQVSTNSTNKPTSVPFHRRVCELPEGTLDAEESSVLTGHNPVQSITKFILPLGCR